MGRGINSSSECQTLILSARQLNTGTEAALGTICDYLRAGFFAGRGTPF